MCVESPSVALLWLIRGQALLSKENSRKCSNPWCSRRIPFENEYKFKQCIRCRVRGRWNVKKRRIVSQHYERGKDHVGISTHVLNEYNRLQARRRKLGIIDEAPPPKEIIEPDVSDKNSAAPGMLGSSTQGGLYAGPTSAATHLLMVRLFFPFPFSQSLHPINFLLPHKSKQKPAIPKTLNANQVKTVLLRIFPK